MNNAFVNGLTTENTECKIINEIINETVSIDIEAFRKVCTKIGGLPPVGYGKILGLTGNIPAVKAF